MGIIKRKKIVDPEAKVDIFSEAFSSVLYIGHIPVASGTFGSLAGLLFFFIPWFNNYLTVGGATVVFFVLGVITSQNMIKRYGHDPSVVVMDEVVGMWVTMLFVLPALNIVDMPVKLIIFGVGFLTFRFFDIVKVWPTKYFDRMNSGYGIMMDDVMAGIYAGLITLLISNLLILVIIFKGLGGKLF